MGERRLPRIDMHVHLAGVGTEGSGCWISPRFASRYTFRLLRRWYGISDEQMRTTVDRDWARSIAEHLRGSEIDAAVVLGFDGVYDGGGAFDEARSQMVVPPGWVFEVCRSHPGLIPGPSVNPNRADAMDRLEECIEGGAALIKWLPTTQGIDPSSARFTPFYRRLAEAGIPLLVHAGGSENTFAEIAPSLKDVRLLEVPLRQGVGVICAHSGTRVPYRRDPDQLPLVRQMLRDHPHFWLDNSGMSNPSRFVHLPRLARDAELVERTLHGSDFPVPTNASYYVHRLGLKRVVALERLRNPLQRDVEIKRDLGYPDAVLTRPAEVLPHVKRWLRPAT